MPELLQFSQRTRPPDAEERADALNIRQSWIVEAPAGSGKTGLVIQRYLKLLADTSVSEPEQVLAITFTNKATAELRERVLAQLRTAADRTEPANDFDRATRPFAEKVLLRDGDHKWSLLDQPGRLNIRTIDSVCSAVANSLPILSGSGGRRTPVEKPAPLYALAARRTFLELGGTDRELHAALNSILLLRDGELNKCEQLLSGMLALRDQWGELVPLGRPRLEDAWLDANILPRLERTLDQVICAAITHLETAIPANVLDQLAIAAADMAHLEGHTGKASPIVVCAGRRNSPGSTADDLDHWKALMHLLIAPSTKSWRKVFGRNVVGFNTGKFEQEQLKQIVRALEGNDQLLAAICRLGSLPPARYPADQWAVAKSLFRILNRALAELQLVFAEQGQCDFTEVALAARTALASSEGAHHSEPPFEAALGFRLQHILVDEMQDTSSSQYELIQTLTRNWDGHSQTAFLVGDPKQSIYLFRQARVERFLRTMRSGRLGDLPVGVLRLTANFRSQAALVDDFNADFATIFPAASHSLHPDEVPYVFVSATRGEPVRRIDDAVPAAALRNGWEFAASASPALRIWHTNVLPYETDASTKHRGVRAQRLADAEEVCNIVNSWRGRPLPPDHAHAWKIAVLCRSRNHLDEIVAAFKSAAIPFRAIDMDPLKERHEVQDLIALTRALLHPADRVAWLAVLRAPWCGLSLVELHTLTGTDSEKSTWDERAMQQVVAERGHLLPDDACQRLQRIWPALEAAVDARARLPLSQLVGRTWRSLGGDSYLNASERANSTRYLKLLDEMEEASSEFDLSALEGRLDKLYAAPTLESDAVDLLTIHKAKGLEWDVVIVPALERRAPANCSRLLNWIELDSSDEGSAHVLLAPIRGKGEASHELTKWINSIQNSREAAEYKRLFYVACTRAREELHLFAAPTRSTSGDIKPRDNSLLAAAWPAAVPHFAGGYSEALALAASADADESLNDSEDQDDIAQGQTEALDYPSLSAFGDGTSLQAVPVQLLLRLAGETMPLQRLRLAFDPASQFKNKHPLRYGRQAEAPAAPHFERPDGSLAARAFGNAVHAFLEHMTQQLAASVSPEKLLATLPEWAPRVAAILRSEGIQPSAVERLKQRVLVALEATLKDSIGLWILSPHPGAATEYALTASASLSGTIRIDRIFRAGAKPLDAPPDHLWIVDYKTTTHGAEGLEDFLENEKTKYAPQLEAYAAVLSASQSAAGIRLALYYPMLAKLIWWSW